MNTVPGMRPLDDIDVRLMEESEEQRETAEAARQEGHEQDCDRDFARRIEFSTFTEGEYVESVPLSMLRALEIYEALGALLAWQGVLLEHRLQLTPQFTSYRQEHCAHEWSYTGTAYGGDDESYHGEGRAYCSKCGADGDA